MTSPVAGFHRLLIEQSASGLRHADIISRTFLTAAKPVMEFGTVADLDRHPLSTRPGTLIIARRPKRGWISVAEHGTLYVRNDEHYLHPIVGCISGCSYCYLQDRPEGRRPLRFYVDVDNLVVAIEQRAHDTGRRLLFCSGELADSLADASLYPVGAELADRFSTGELGNLELRTKSNNVHSLLGVRHNRRTTVAFSVSPAAHVARYEPRTASLTERLEAAARVALAGYPVALKCEPVILDEGWRAAYSHMFAETFTALPPNSLDHVSIGCLRWSEALALTQGFAGKHQSALRDGTYIEYRPGKFNRMVSRPKRLRAYQALRSMLREAGFRAPIYWSLEEPEVVSALDT